MIEVTLTPEHRLKLGVDYPLHVTYPAAHGIQGTDTARLTLRLDVYDPAPLNTLSTADGTLTLTVHGDGRATVQGLLTGEHSRAYPITTPTGEPRLRALDPEDAPTLGGDAERYRVLPVYGTLVVTDASGVDRLLTALDFRLLMEATYARE